MCKAECRHCPRAWRTGQTQSSHKVLYRSAASASNPGCRLGTRSRIRRRTAVYALDRHRHRWVWTNSWRVNIVDTGGDIATLDTKVRLNVYSYILLASFGYAKGVGIHPSC